MGDSREIARVVIQPEGDFHQAYYAKLDTMEGALPLGSLHRAFSSDPGLFEAFIGLMHSSAAFLVKKALGEQPTFGEVKMRHPGQDDA